MVSLERPNSKGNLTKLNYWKGNFVEINKKLTEIEWESELNGLEVEEMWNKFQKVLMQLVQKNVPVKKPVKKKKSPWISSETIKLIRKRGEAWKEYREQPSDINYEKYKDIRNTVTSLVRRDHNLHQRKLIENFKGNNKRFYGYVRNLQTIPACVTRVIANDGTLTNSDKETVEVLGE
jgi:hypothetical protein